MGLTGGPRGSRSRPGKGPHVLDVPADRRPGPVHLSCAGHTPRAQSATRRPRPASLTSLSAGGSAGRGSQAAAGPSGSGAQAEEGGFSLVHTWVPVQDEDGDRDERSSHGSERVCVLEATSGVSGAPVAPPVFPPGAFHCDASSWFCVQGCPWGVPGLCHPGTGGQHGKHGTGD